VGISWLPPAQPVAVAAGLVAAVVAPDERSAELAAVAAAPDEAVARPRGAVEVLASPPAEPDAAVAAVVQPGAAARLAEFPASAGPAERA
jgi:hypothetical protein